MFGARTADTPTPGTAARTAWLLPLLLAAPLAVAQGPGTVTIDLGECAELASEAERIACFGERVNAMVEAEAAASAAAEAAAEAAAAAPATPATGEPAAPSRREQRAARRAAQAQREALAEREALATRERELAEREAALARQERDSAERAAAAATAAAEEYAGTIASFRERLPYSWVITLADGQVWEQVQPKRYRLTAGQAVTISPTRWGNDFRLVAEGSGSYISVRRVR